MSMVWFQFLAGALLVIIAGTRLTRSADVLGRALGLGTGWAGVLLLPLATSLPELVTSMQAAIIQAPDLAAGNLFGSNLFNITIIALVDLMQGKGSIFLRVKKGHILAASLGILLMSISGIGILLPFPFLWGSWIGLDTILLMGGYLAAARLLTSYEKRNSSLKHSSAHIEGRTVEKDSYLALTPPRRALVHFVAASAVILFAGVALTNASDIIALETGLGRTFVGSIMLAVATSLPEVVTTTTAARLGRLDMAIGNIFGANVYNMFILAIIDIFYLPGPLLQAISSVHLLTIVMAIILTSMAITGLVYRSRRSIGWLSFDSIFIVIGYLIAVAVLFYTRGG
ncbi:MAG: sodium:calcium antiporter [Dethiobacter sp.]|jgi:cation:H+ antiporter|nr:MAG: sodium:calcium antiporter [Dethiobacter sp.]